MVRNFDGAGALIEQWLKNKDTVLFLGVWERINNPGFNSIEFEGIRNEAGRNSFFLSAKKWIDLTGAISPIESECRKLAIDSRLQNPRGYGSISLACQSAGEIPDWSRRRDLLRTFDSSQRPDIGDHIGSRSLAHRARGMGGRRCGSHCQFTQARLVVWW